MPQNVNSEAKAQKELVDFLVTKNWWLRKLHGNLYQMGLPDLLVGRKKDGLLMLIEMKILKGTKAFYQIDLIEALKGPQIGNILLLAKIQAPVWIIAKCYKGWLAIRAPFHSTERVYPLTLESLYEKLNG